jgi:hypothetical protein
MSDILQELNAAFPRIDNRYMQLIVELISLHEKKVADYGPIDSEEGNLKASAEFGISPWVGVCLRMNDKWKRIKHFIKQGNLVNESVEDSLIDFANYALLALFLYKHCK